MTNNEKLAAETTCAEHEEESIFCGLCVGILAARRVIALEQDVRDAQHLIVELWNRAGHKPAHLSEHPAMTAALKVTP